MGQAGHMVFACGMGQNAQLGVGDQENHSLPQRVVELPEGAFFMDAAAGSQHTLLLTSKELLLIGADVLMVVVVVVVVVVVMVMVIVVMMVMMMMAFSPIAAMNEVYCWGAMGPAVLQPGRPNNVVFPTYCELTQSLNIVKIRIGRLHGIALSSIIPL